jgi:hypothetical protein
LADNQTLLEYFVGDSSIFVFVVNKNGFHVQELKKNFPLENWVQQMRKGIYAYLTHSNDPSDSLYVRSYDYSAKQYVEAASQLYDKLIAPIKDKLSDNAIILGDNAHVTDKLSRFSIEQNRDFLYFQEQPKNHWYPGAGNGFSFTRR